MHIEIEKNLRYKGALKVMAKQWLLLERRENETITDFSKRIGIERCNFYKLLKTFDIPIQKWQESHICYFCRDENDLQEHHVYGRTEPDKISICRSCHQKFHLLERHYKKPNKKKPL